MEWKEIEAKLDLIWSEEAIADDIEDQFLDIKKDPKSWKGLIEMGRKMTVCFSNANGGHVVIGIRERTRGMGAFEGCTKHNLRELKKRINDGLNSSVDIDLEYRDYKGVKLLEIKIPQGFYGAHSLRDAGAQWVRAGAECKAILPSTISQPKFLPISELDRSSALIPDMDWNDIDKTELRKIKSIIKKEGFSLDYIDMNDIDFAKALGLISKEEGKEALTMAGLLFIGKKSNRNDLIPQSEVNLISFDEGGDSDFQIIYNKGMISNAIELQELFYKKFNERILLDTGLFEIPIDRIPQKALREGVLNALTHRDYTKQASVYFRIYPDRIEISSPGGFIDDINPDNILYHMPAYRNRLIADVFQRIGLVRRSGIGIDRMYRYLLNNGKEPPIFRSDDSHVSLILMDNIDKEMASYIRNEEESAAKKIPLDELIIISHLRNSPEISTSETAKIIQREPEEALNILTKMARSNVIVPKGKGKGRVYSFSPKMYADLGDSLGYARDDGRFEKIRWKEKARMIVKEKGFLTNSDMQKLSGYTQQQVKVLLREMVEDGELELKGIKRGAKYYLPEKPEKIKKRKTKSTDRKSSPKLHDFD